ncbi:MAG TPA: hypothetical protein VKA27_17920 [Sunxiuqinia sp.]|nr:hypothetical protein [Sunxiuqinia sp.]
MQNNMRFRLLLLLFSITIAGCSKNEIATNQDKIIGTWIAIDKSDTLDFTTNTDFFKSNGYLFYDHYDYELFKDSIKIGYRGNLMILIRPTMHAYTLDQENLTIDLSNTQCYGFEKKVMIYKKASQP